MHPQDTSFLVNGFKPTVAAAQPQDVMAFQQRQQLGAQQLQGGAMDLQQKQIEMNDQENLRQNYMQSGGDMDKFQQLNMQSGVSPKAIMGVQKSVLDMKEAKAKLTGANLDNQAKTNDNLSALLAPVAAETDPVKQAALWDQQMKIGVANSVMTPAEAAAHPYPGVEGVKGYMAHLQTDKWISGQAAAKTAQAHADQAATAATKQNIEAPQQAAAALMAQTQQGAQVLGGATGQLDYTDKLGKLPPAVATQFPPTWDGSAEGQAAVNRVGMTPEQRTMADQKKLELAAAAKRDAETNRHNLSDEANAKINAGIAGGRLALERSVNGMKYGPGTQQYWVQQLTENPDSIKEMPPELRSTVGMQFKQATGLPLPTALGDTARNQETATRNTMANIDWLKNAAKDPRIASQVGPISGNLGNAEQATGSAAFTDPATAQLAQEFRTRMRQFVLQDAKSLAGGRVTKQVLDQLQSSSAKTTMDPALMAGALDGAGGNAQTIMDGLDSQRFGGKTRTPQQRGMQPRAVQAAPGIPTPGQAEYDAMPKGAAFKKPGDPTTYYKGQ